MTPRPQHARGTRARRGRHRPAGDAGRAVRRGTQALATVVAALREVAAGATAVDAAGIGEELLARLADSPEDDVAVVVVRI
ncbi:hypothetical protein, partial [Cellulomonas hominis]|uniref:hypothetical protein n=1 Tax=Cellulomonas hominis TaxID=156981 RepID=UPI001443AFCB